MWEFNLDWKAEFNQINLAHLTQNNKCILKKKLKQTNANAPLIRCGLNWLVVIPSEIK